MVKLFLLAFTCLHVFAKPDPAFWIGQSLDTIGTLTLKNLTMPGTHDSGAYYLTSAIIPGDASGVVETAIHVSEDLGIPVEDIITPWSLAQDRDIYQQMEGGIRYIDFRCAWYKDSWHTFHFEVGNLCQTLLLNASQFLHDHPQEIVILEISHFDGDPSDSDVEALEDLVIAILGSYLYHVDPEFSATLNELVETDQRALVTMDKTSGRYSSKIWSSDAIYNTYADSDKLSKMEDYNTGKIKDYLSGAHPTALYKISWTLTPAADAIIKAPLPFTPNSLKELADTANRDLLSFYKSSKSEGLVRWGNIVIIDHFETSPLLDVVLDMNGVAPLT
jgi:hypothetical protein